ncbi:MAG: hypothetical protein BM485_02740 [Desulfobulbaceae bacterium DB1]|nr:MAG: hypothetical protein BM485_02740 [Desulfobulbaceae bacterium DB1]
MQTEKKMPATRALFSVLFLAAFITAPSVVHADELSIDTVIAPGVLIIDKTNSCTNDDCDVSVDSLTVHAAIAYSTVDRALCPVELCYDACTEAVATFADSRGELVAKFAIADVLALGLEKNAYNELTMSGCTTTPDQTFSGSDVIYLKTYGASPADPPVGPMGPGAPPAE